MVNIVYLRIVVVCFSKTKVTAFVDLDVEHESFFVI